MLNEAFFNSREELTEALTTECHTTLTQAVEERGEATFFVSGGSSPAPVYDNLSKADLPWANIQVAMVDERWVDADHPGSNETFVNTSLLQNKAADAALLAMKTEAPTAAEGLEECEASYRELPQPFDMIILGMGPDGHTASLFPHAQGLDAALDPESDNLCAAIMAEKSPVTGDNLERMTLSLAGILKAKHIVLLISGDEKLSVYRQALAGDDASEMPVRAVLKQQKVPVTVYWAP